MLWDAGQERTVREGRERLAELYVGVRDGYVAGRVAAGASTWKGGEHVPSYARSERPPTLRSPAVRDLTLAKLGVAFPGMVRRLDS
jgi:hypothetical protein